MFFNIYLRRLEIYFKHYAVYKEDKREWDRLCEIDSKLRERIKATIFQQKVAPLWLSVLSLRRDLPYVQKVLSRARSRSRLALTNVSSIESNVEKMVCLRWLPLCVKL